MRSPVDLASSLSLRARLTLLAALGAGLVLPLVVGLLYGAVSDALDDAVTAELRVRAEDVAAEVAAGLRPVMNEGLVTQVLDADGALVGPGRGAPLVDRADLPTQAGLEVVQDRPVSSIGENARVLVRQLPSRTGDGWVIVAGSTKPIVECAAAKEPSRNGSFPTSASTYTARSPRRRRARRSTRPLRSTATMSESFRRPRTARAVKRPVPAGTSKTGPSVRTSASNRACDASEAPHTRRLANRTSRS